MKKPLIGVTCNYDFRDEVGRVNGQGAIGQDGILWRQIISVRWSGRGHFRWSFLSLMMLPMRLVFESGWMGCWSVAEMMWTHSDIISRCEIADG